MIQDNEPDTEPLIWRHLRGIRRVVINTCHGGFGLSHEAVLLYHELQGQTIYHSNPEDVMHLHYWTDPADPGKSGFYAWELDRDDPYLVRVVETLGGEDAGGRAAMLKIVEIPENVEWHIQEHDGMEWVAERHRTWS